LYDTIWFLLIINLGENKMKTLLLSVLLLTVNSWAMHPTGAKPSDGTGAWVDVPLTDTQPFDVNCEYRVWYMIRGDDDTYVKYGNGFRTYMDSKGVATHPNYLFISDYEFAYYDINPHTINLAIDSKYKKRVIDYYYPSDPPHLSHPISKIQKRCAIVPVHQVSLFNLPTCPVNWKLVPPPTATANGYIYCEKT
jgi:hypothetical protein